MADNKLSLIVSFIGQDKLSGALKNIIGLGRNGDQALRGMFREAKNLKGEMRSLDAEIAKGSGNVTVLVDKQKALADALDKVNRQIDRQKGANAFAADTRRIGARGDEMKGRGVENIAGGAALSAPLVLAGSAAMDFSSGMVDIQQKAELTNAETAKMAGNIMALARATHQLPEDMRAGVDVLAGFGMDPRQAVAMIGPIGRLGTAFKVDLADGAAAAFANLNNLKIPVDQTAKALDIMAAGGKAGAFEVKDMARWFPALTANLQALGQQGTPAVADITAALQVAMNTAGNADEAANNIANLMGKINSPTVIKAFSKNFGVDLPSAMKKFQAQGMTSMEAFAMATQKATGGDMKKLGFVLEDRQAQMGVLALIQNMDKYRQIRAQISNGSGGTVDSAFKQREAQDASVAWAGFKGTLSELAITMGANLLPAATQVFGAISAGVSSVAQWARANPEAARTLMMLVTGFIGAKVALGVLQYAFGSILSTVASARTVFSMASTMFGGLRVAVMFLARGVMQAGLMMLANPMVAAIVVIGLALAGLAYVVYSNWDKIKGAFATGWQWVKDTLSAAPGWLSTLGGQMMNGLLSMIDPFGLRNRLLDVARNGIAAFKSFFGIKSPSRLMMEMGGHVAGGLATGLTRNGAQPVRAMGRMAAAVAGAGAIGLAAPSIATPSISAPSLSPRSAGSGDGAGGSVSIGPIYIQQQPGEDAKDLADRVIEQIERKQRGARARGFEPDF